MSLEGLPPLQTGARDSGRLEQNQGVSMHRNISALFRNRLPKLEALPEGLQPTSNGLQPPLEPL